MLRTALGPAIARFLEDPKVVEVMLNPDGRLWIYRLCEGLSDTGERLSPADGERIVRLVALRTKDGVASLSDLVRSSLRLRPDRIPIGEVRGGEALDLLKAWGTGHPGGIGTIHAGTALGALRRMEQLIQETVVTVPRVLIAETIQLVAVLAGRGSARRLAELTRVEGLGPAGDYALSTATMDHRGDHS